VHIERTLRDKIAKTESFFGNSQAAVYFEGRELTDAEVDSLIKIIKDGSRLEITEVFTDVFYDSAVLTPQTDDVPEENGSGESKGEHLALFHNGSLRSGQSLRYAGSVVLTGDVNAGAEIVAEGNVIVLGTIRGLVHAGCSGDTSCIVSALSMQPTQLRIADILIYIPAEMSKKNKKRIDPVYAHISDGEIFISPLGSRE
jgi:septum site-determining protein MinC